MVTLLDGGMGTELIARGAAWRGGLWSAQALLDAPEAVTKLHKDYISAGAEVITTNTYSTVPSYLDKAGAGHRLGELASLAGELARAAAEDTAAKVAGSLPPLSESYRPDLVPEAAAAESTYRQLAEALAPFVDLFLCETMSSIEEAHTAAAAALGVSAVSKEQQVFISWTVDDNPGRGLRSGESIADAVQSVSDMNIAGFLINCSRPEAIATALEQLRATTDKPIGCYANRMEGVPEGWTLDNDQTIAYRDDLSASIFAEWGRRSVAAGASIIGGCCGTKPSDIEALRRAIANPISEGEPSGAGSTPD